MKSLAWLITTGYALVWEAEKEPVGPPWTGLNDSVTLEQVCNLSLPFKSPHMRGGTNLLTWENLSHRAMANSSYPSGTRPPTV